MFFGPRNASPTDRPEHFDHSNGAEALISVRLAADDFTAERELLSAVGASFVEAEVQVHEAPTAARAETPDEADARVHTAPNRSTAVLTEEAGADVAEAVTAAVAELPQGSVVLLPGSYQMVPGRRIVGATLRTRSLDALVKALEDAKLDVPPIVEMRHGRSIFLPPEVTHGIWLEFSEPK